MRRFIGGFYAINLAVIRGYVKNAATEAFLGELLSSLEATKSLISDHPALSNDTAGLAYIHDFSGRIFDAADNEDRAGEASKKTARMFLVAAHFIETAKIFGPLETEWEDKCKYAKFKAADIVKAINAGKTPAPGPPGIHSESEEQRLSKPEDQGQEGRPKPPETANTSAMPSAARAEDSQSDASSSLPSMSGTYQRATFPSTPILSSSDPNYAVLASIPSYDPLILADAERHARYAISALQFEDVPTALRNLELAAKILSIYQPKQ